MRANPFAKFRFRLKSLFVLMLGIAIGYSLNLRTWQLLIGRATNSRSPVPYTIEPPDVLSVHVSGKPVDASRSISGKHLVAPDGTINLSTYGQVYVAGMTTSEVQDAIKKAVAGKIKTPQVVVDVVSYDSKVYYVVTQGIGNIQNVLRLPITGNETVLDAIAQIGGVVSPDSTAIWISRSLNGSVKTLPIEWEQVDRVVSPATNYQMMPGDRLFVSQKSPAAAAAN